MKKIFICAAIAATALLAGSCRYIKITDKSVFSNNFNGSGVEASDVQVDKEYDVDEFSVIELDAQADVFYEFGPECTVSISGPDNIVALLDVEVVDGVLKISSDDQKFHLGSKKLIVNIASPTLSNVEINGAGDFTSHLGFSAQDFSVDVRGAGDVDIDKLVAKSIGVTVKGAGDIELQNIECETLRVDIRGAGDAVISGNADSADLTIKGAGDIDIRDLNVGDVHTDLSGVGSVRRKK